ncbi:MAG: amino acid adenylation domain-containing protein, partial [Oscillospiraceae bacterium]|nr:amino acid adenylation domain-containing protein [Oscillospiraceae bacterium]
GNYYVPIDEAMPPARMEAILTQLQPPLLLYASSQEQIARRLAHLCPVLNVDEGAQESADDALLESRRARVLDVDPAYVIFTSGSTGTPKGIVVSHRSVIDFTEWMADACQFSQNDVLANQAPFYFDLSVKDLYLTMKCGASCHILAKKLFMFPLLLLREIERVGATALVWATSAFHLLANSGGLERCRPQTLNKVILGGEALGAKQLNVWRSALPHVQYINLYGPTEVTVDCTWYLIPKDRPFSDGEAIPIGTPCRNMEVLLLDKELHPIQEGQVGEICVRGIGLANGYYGNWDKTQTAFIQNPLNPWYPDRVYRTGDLGFRGTDGLLYFAARCDNQIKHMGYRIELGEVETALNGVEGIAAAVCFFDQEHDRIVCVCQTSLTDKEIIAALRETLPKYMQPNIYHHVDTMPYNANGKIDRVRLKEEYFGETGS